MEIHGRDNCCYNRPFDDQMQERIHIASAEEVNADVLLTTDDRFEKMAEKLDLKTRVVNPLRFAWEVI
ncbi:MAG: hypothetical protein K2P07_06410 [Lachnospiraceae bacterium]|nr:hypothetical protein [Lachnospiraceae bacterium]